jgi:cation diffusion facilitator CzcD-associated flavoprotein CzcO
MEKKVKQSLISCKIKHTIYSFNFLIYNFRIGGIGVLRIPNIPEHLTKFDGPWIHSAKWDHSVELKDKVVGVVGSASR